MTERDKGYGVADDRPRWRAVASWLAGAQLTGMARVRRLLLGFAVLAVGSSAGQVVMHGPSVWLIVLGLAASALVLVLRVLDLTRPRPLPVALVPVEAAALLAVLLAAGPLEGVSVLYAVAYSLVPSRSATRVLTGIGTAVGVLLAAYALVGGSGSAVAANVFGLVFGTGLTFVIVRIVSAESDERHRQERFLAAVMESLDTGVIACDRDGTLSLFNRAAERMHEESMLGARYDQWTRLAEQHGLDSELPLARAFAGERVENATVDVPMLDGVRTSVVNAQPIVDPSGERVGAVAALHEVTERQRAERRLEQMALHDHLTGLPNRRRLEHELTQVVRAVEAGSSSAVLVLDLDDFKLLNDSQGHLAGDRLLVRASGVLRSLLRPQDLLARLGGDEFAVVLRDVGEAEAIAVADRVSAAFASTREIRAPGHPPVTVSIGIVPVRAGDTPDQLLRNGDLAMYAAKEAGKNRWSLYDPTMHERLLETLAIEKDLAGDLEACGLHLHYQPVVDLTTMRPRGFEALLRWDHERFGALSPARFIPVAESSGAMARLGIWVLRRAVRQLAEWRELGAGTAGLAVSVNLSPSQIDSPDLVPDVLRALQDAGLPPESLVLEVTESGLLRRETDVATLQQLADHGIRLAIDDFGAGFSSLARIQALPAHEIKLDRSLIRDIGSGGALARAAIEFTHALGRHVVVEGIETAEQLEFVRSHGCRWAQGFLLGRPAAPDAVRAQLTDDFQHLRV